MKNSMCERMGKKERKMNKMTIKHIIDIRSETFSLFYHKNMNHKES